MTHTRNLQKKEYFEKKNKEKVFFNDFYCCLTDQLKKIKNPKMKPHQQIKKKNTCYDLMT